MQSEESDFYTDFYRWSCNFDGYARVKGKIMMSRLCSCEVEGFIVIRLYAGAEPCHDYEHCIDLYCHDIDLFCLKFKPGEWVRAEISISGRMIESWKREIHVPPANTKEFYRMTGKVVSSSEVDFRYFRLVLERCRIPGYVRYVDVEANMQIDEIYNLKK